MEGWYYLTLSESAFGEVRVRGGGGKGGKRAQRVGRLWVQQEEAGEREEGRLRPSSREGVWWSLAHWKEGGELSRRAHGRVDRERASEEERARVSCDDWMVWRDEDLRASGSDACFERASVVADRNRPTCAAR